VRPETSGKALENAVFVSPIMVRLASAEPDAVAVEARDAYFVLPGDISGDSL
jgi:hypothetical protein